MSTIQTQVVQSLFENGPQTRKDFPVSVFNESLYNMEKAGVIKRLKVTQKHDKANPGAGRGRPLTVWTLTDKQKKRMKRAASKVTA